MTNLSKISGNRLNLLLKNLSKDKNPQSKMNDLPTLQGEINTSWGIDLSEAMNAMGKAAEKLIRCRI